jgi:hypothetical protein
MNMPEFEYIALSIFTSAGARPMPEIASYSTSPVHWPVSSLPASSMGTFSVLPLVLVGVTASVGSTSFSVAANASP